MKPITYLLFLYTYYHKNYINCSITGNLYPNKRSLKVIDFYKDYAPEYHYSNIFGNLEADLDAEYWSGSEEPEYEVTDR